MTAATPVLLIDQHDAVLTLTLNRPGAFNAFDRDLLAALLDALTGAAQDEQVRAVVITGAGPAFCAGHDLKEHLAAVGREEPAVSQVVADYYNPLVRAVTGMHKPVIAAVNGVAAGAGAGLAFACDLRLAAASASFVLAFAGAGLSADTGASYTLPRLIGTGRALQLMLTGERVSADRAADMGLVASVVPDTKLAARAAALAAELAAGPTAAYGRIKAAVHHAATTDLESALEFEDRAQQACFASSDHHEGLTAFVQKRRPEFRGR